MERKAFACLTGSVFFAAFSMPTGRILLGLAGLLLVIDAVRGRNRPTPPPVTFYALAFLVLLAVVTVFGVNPQRGVHKLDKLLWFMGIPIAGCLAVSPMRRMRLVMAYAFGSGVLALRLLVERPLGAHALVADGRFDTMRAALIDLGSMTDGQRLMIGLLLTLGLLSTLERGRRRALAGWLALLALILVGFVINFKRGSWLCGVGVAGLFVLMRAGWRWALVALAVAAAILATPAVRTRLADLRNEFHSESGRLTMWTKVAPALIRAHPWGIGYRSLTNEMMREIVPTIEPNRDHLHSNPLQILVAAGWLGFTLYAAWMVRALIDGWRAWRRVRADPGDGPVTLALMLALVALLLNGLVEYNFGDAEIVLAYGFLMGVCAAGTAGEPLREREA